MTDGYPRTRHLAARFQSIGRWLLAVAGVTVLLAGCTSLKVGNDYDRAADFSGFRSFSLMSRNHHGSGNPLVTQRARDAIQAELTRRGFSFVSDVAAADFVVDFTIGSRERVDIETYPAPYAGPYWGYPGWWGYRYWGSEVDARQYREGTLSIDIFDARTHKPVWHGWATKELTRSDMEHSEAPIRAAVKSVLTTFPPQA
jgi:Domain of unknown function (DUF4136)